VASVEETELSNTARDQGNGKQETAMNEHSDPEDRLLSEVEHDMVAQTKPPVLDQLTKPALQALVKRLRSARDRARRIGRQQRLEIRGKGDPKGAVPARDNAGTEAKAQVLIEAVNRVTAALRKMNVTSQAKPKRKVTTKPVPSTPQHPVPGKTLSEGMRAKPSRRPTVKLDPREIGRVSRAGKVAQARRDR
jgi:hypothetical protein